MAVVHLFGPVSIFYKFWRVSFADFVASMLCFWITIFVSAETGIETGAGFCVAWTMLRYAFAKPTVRANTVETLTSTNVTSTGSVNSAHGSRTEFAGLDIPSDCVLISFNDSMFYPNSGRAKTTSLEGIQLVYEKLSSLHHVDPRNRSWSVGLENKVKRLRKERNIVPRDAHLAIVVLDFTKVSFIDVTAILALGELEQDVRLYSGKEVQFRFFGLSKSVHERFMRANWKLTDLEGWNDDDGDVVYPSLQRAIWERDSVSDIGEKAG